MKNSFSLKFLTVLAFLLILCSCGLKTDKFFTEADIKIIPKVESLQVNSGVFEFNKNTLFVVTDNSQETAAQLLIDKFKTVNNWDLKVVSEQTNDNYIVFNTDVSLKNEAYTLRVTSNNISISASSYSGFLYGVQSLRMLLPTAIESKKQVSDIVWQIPNIEIKDSPRFKWRGLMLDLSRHFFDKDYIKETIDAISLLKMNVLHLHLVDDHGWRIEIKKHPRLTEVGAWRVDQEHMPWNKRATNSPEEKGTYGGFLTQEELKEVVAYAELKGVEVVPEIEMPAHVSSAIAAYPELSCLEKPIGVPSGALWPITDIYCAGKEYTFEFLEDVLMEVIDIFPSKYIHIGGDEATKTNWKTCPHCQKRMKQEGLHDVEELQSYFVKRMEKFINSKGKKLIGWDEILEGGLAPGATVMSWRGFKGGLQAAGQGHDVVMTPTDFCYFDYYQGPPEQEPVAGGSVTTLSKVYQFDPVVDSMTEEEANHVLGGQANLWAEHVSTEPHSQYMIFPRLAALSETVWSPKASRNWDDFSNRLISMFQRYDYLGINYAKSSFIVTSDMKIDVQNKTVSLILHNEYPNSNIKYALNDEALDNNSKPFVEPIILSKTTAVKAGLFKDDVLFGDIFQDTIKFHKGVANNVMYNTDFNERYQGAGDFNLVNTLRGTKNFRDGRWQAWLNSGVDVTIDLETEKEINQVTVGSMENQKNGIFYPTLIQVFVSNDGEIFNEITSFNRLFVLNENPELKDFILPFDTLNTRFVKIKISLSNNIRERNEGWIFVDEILID
ncbi:beta-N-acetylhexosaminidase [Pseudalgibacter alginicilyticus]|uniref:beta-N-acetylhexosaminidase n=1 Tax=Pseudalgibacter alginicilyticus TaxID=1736674 RepID=A0A0P0D8L7_9FLAO|nr:family 20 glycosylhydrolase [Pseudalgibacter alginicilyticus]ALJ04186.1 beta-N-acetylhexosaminidase [Pseudalgibacter alginicilyticus]